MVKNKLLPLRVVRTQPPLNAKPFTLDEASAAVRLLGVKCTTGYLANVERGARRPSPRLMWALSVVYGVERATVERAVDRTTNLRR